MPLRHPGRRYLPCLSARLHPPHPLLPQWMGRVPFLSARSQACQGERPVAKAGQPGFARLSPVGIEEASLLALQNGPLSSGQSEGPGHPIAVYASATSLGIPDYDPQLGPTLCLMLAVARTSQARKGD